MGSETVPEHETGHGKILVPGTNAINQAKDKPRRPDCQLQASLRAALMRRGNWTVRHSPRGALEAPAGYHVSALRREQILASIIHSPAALDTAPAPRSLSSPG